VYFDKELYMFQTDLLSIIRSLNTVYTEVGMCHSGYADCLLASSQHNQHDIYHCCVYSARLLMMDRKTV